MGICPFRKEIPCEGYGNLSTPSACAVGTCELYLQKTKTCALKSVATSLKSISESLEKLSKSE